MLAGPLSYAAWLRMSQLSWAKQSIMNCVLKQGIAANKLRKGTKQSSKAFAAICTVSSLWICGQVQQAGTHNDTDLRINLLMCCTCGTLRPRSVLSRQRRTNTCCQGNLVDLDVDLTRAKAEQNELDAGWHRSSESCNWKGRALQRVKQWKQVLVRKQFNANWPHYIWLWLDL